MYRTVSTRLALTAALVLTVTAAAAAQNDTPEGIDWHLTEYLDGREMVQVPWFVDATLQLESGEASGSTGCNRFFGSYELVGQQLTIDLLGVTEQACGGDPYMTIERGYLDAFAQTTRAVVDTGATESYLYLRNDSDQDVLTYETSAMSLTTSDVRALAAELEDLRAQIDRQEKRIDNIRIGTLRDRIKELESEVKTLGSAASSSSSGGRTFTGAEKQLLKGIPGRIRSTCAPLRSGLPSGTLAAVRCDPGNDLVADMAYYLLPYKSAERTFTGVMDRHSVPERYRCMDGRQSQALQSPYHATGCFVDGGSANVRLVTWAASCQQLDINGKRVRAPAAYVAIEGTGDHIKPLYDWATTDGTPAPVWSDIPVSGNPPSPGCVGPAG